MGILETICNYFTAHWKSMLVTAILAAICIILIIFVYIPNKDDNEEPGKSKAAGAILGIAIFGFGAVGLFISGIWADF